MSYIPDALDMFERHDAELEEAIEMLPKCTECGEPIQDEYCFVINDMPIHESCMNENYRVPTTDLMG